MRTSYGILAFIAVPAIMACSAEAPEPERQGTFQMPLVSTSPSGRQYRLTGDFEIAGPEARTLSAGGDVEAVEVALRVGDYQLGLAPGWQLERVEGETAVPVEATLTSPVPVPFTIQQDALTEVALAFQVQGEAVVFGTGTLRVVFEVEDQAFETSCSDGVDNDSDGLVDCADPECAASSDCATQAENCSNGVDDDGDGFVDCADAECIGSPSCAVPACGDGVAQSGELCFSAAEVVPAPVFGTIAYLTSGDFDADGLRDLAVASANPASVVALMNRNGNFVPGPVLSLGGEISALDAGRLNADANDDLIVANRADGTVRGFTVAFDGSISQLGGYSAGVGSPVRAKAADLNGDGRTDVAVASDFELVVLQNTGNNLAQVAAGLPVPAPVGDMAVADFDGDGLIDVAVGRRGGSTDLRFFFGSPGGVPVPGPTTTASVTTLGAMFAADLNGDGLADLVLGSSQLPQAASVLGGSLVSTSFPLAPVSSLALADLDHDGRVDLLAASRFESRHLIAGGDGGGGFALLESVATPVAAASLAVDVSGDGHADIVVAGSNQVLIRRSNP